MSALLAVERLSKRFGGFTALSDISLSVAPGERLGLIGPNGSGKSTFTNCLCGTLRSDGGSQRFAGRRIDRLAAHQRTRLGIARSFQLPRPFHSLIGELLGQFGLGAKSDRLPRDLTQVEMRKLELARAMATAPKLLVADEAMAGLSSAEVDEILVLLMELNRTGVAIIFIEHIMRAVIAFSQRLVVFVAGRKIADGPPAAVLADAQVLGTNCNGKSTLIKAIMGIVRPVSGSIVATIDGREHELIGMATEAIVDLGIALVPEGRRLFPRLTVQENLLLGAYRPSARERMRENLAYCYDAFPRLAERRRQLASTMSGGEQQMLALGRALMSRPSILIVDEPSVGLAPLLVSRTVDKIKELKDRYSLTVLMAEQNFTQAIRIADEGYVIVHGEIAFHGNTPEAMQRSDLVRQLYLGS